MDQSMIAFAMRGLGLPDYVVEMAKKVATMGDGRDPLDLLHDDSFILSLREAFPKKDADLIPANNTKLIGE